MLDGIEKGGYMSHDGMCKNEYMLLCVNFCASYLISSNYYNRGDSLNFELRSIDFKHWRAAENSGVGE